MARMPMKILTEKLATLHFGEKNASIRRAQDVAMLLAQSGWTHEELARPLHKGRRWVGRQITFGKFLGYIRSGPTVPQSIEGGFDRSGPTVPQSIEGGFDRNAPVGAEPDSDHAPVGAQLQNGDDSDHAPVGAQLTEGRFRKLWEQTDKDDDDAERFAEVARLLQEEDSSKGVDTRTPSALVARVMAQFGDAKWHPLDRMAESVGAGTKEVAAAIKAIERKYGAKIENKTVGIRPNYRIFRRDNSAGRVVGVPEIVEKCRPHIEALLLEGKKHGNDVARHGSPPRQYLRTANQ